MQKVHISGRRVTNFLYLTELQYSMFGFGNFDNEITPLTHQDNCYKINYL